jgi:hypothetical protein
VLPLINTAKKVATGEANVIAPTEKLVIAAPQLPTVTVS